MGISIEEAKKIGDSKMARGVGVSVRGLVRDYIVARTEKNDAPAAKEIKTAMTARFKREELPVSIKQISQALNNLKRDTAKTGVHRTVKNGVAYFYALPVEAQENKPEVTKE